MSFKDKIWEMVIVGSSTIQSKFEGVTFSDNAGEKYRETFDSLYNKVSLYMENKDGALDRHKTAAIIMISIIESNPLICESDANSDKVFMANYVLAAEIGLSYMLEMLNQKLNKKGEKSIEKYFFPEAMSCSTEYFQIFYRNLYYAHTDWILNPLDMAERLFLLEYMTLKENDVNPNLLKEY